MHRPVSSTGRCANCLDSRQQLLLDLTRCGYIDSGGLAVLIYLTRRLTPCGWLGVVVTSETFFAFSKLSDWTPTRVSGSSAILPMRAKASKRK